MKKEDIDEMRTGLRKLAGSEWLPALLPEQVNTMSEEELIATSRTAFKDAMLTWAEIIKWLRPALQECLRLIMEWYDALPQEYKDAIAEHIEKEELS